MLTERDSGSLSTVTGCILSLRAKRGNLQKKERFIKYSDVVLIEYITIRRESFQPHPLYFVARSPPSLAQPRRGQG